MEEWFFFKYHLKMSKSDALQLPIHERKWMAQRFMQQREMEREYIETQRRQAKGKH